MFKNYVKKKQDICHCIKVTKEMIDNLDNLPPEIQPYRIHPHDQTDGNIDEYIKQGTCGLKEPTPCLIIESQHDDVEREFVREGDYLRLTENGQLCMMYSFTIEKEYMEVPNEIT